MLVPRAASPIPSVPTHPQRRLEVLAEGVQCRPVVVEVGQVAAAAALGLAEADEGVYEGQAHTGGCQRSQGQQVPAAPAAALGLGGGCGRGRGAGRHGWVSTAHTGRYQRHTHVGIKNQSEGQQVPAAAALAVREGRVGSASASTQCAQLGLGRTARPGGTRMGRDGRVVPAAEGRRRSGRKGHRWDTGACEGPAGQHRYGGGVRASCCPWYYDGQQPANRQPETTANCLTCAKAARTRCSSRPRPPPPPAPPPPPPTAAMAAAAAAVPAAPSAEGGPAAAAAAAASPKPVPPEVPSGAVSALK